MNGSGSSRRGEGLLLLLLVVLDLPLFLGGMLGGLLLLPFPLVLASLVSHLGSSWFSGCGHRSG